MNHGELVRRYFPEAHVNGFSHIDGTVIFYTQIRAALKPTDRVLDFGAGRGESLWDDTVEYRRELCNLQGSCAHIEGCDLDKVVLENPFVDHAEVVTIGQPLPYPDHSFDIVIARAVFEHVSEPDWVVQELLRVVKPGGLIAATTPNKTGYIGLAARLVPNRFHVAALSKIQPTRKPEDVFPTRYLLNTPKALQRAFGHAADVFVARTSPEPAYHFGSPFLFRVMMLVARVLPSWLQPTLYVYIRAHAA
ncbi:methylase involved in ubiquinone/menaquinone biosynthesis [Mycobacterium sp. JS623]|uniref:class I SAM-dependent methyltransferase n=1 Tax=Mycobacterium sp. JS623 TaxID=212767 RepID=UPI0002A5A2B4|nr:class I SAM-dependent methyltransferase [Mycobacterium sp. JS623]AGB21774.1 methylase involved in ubiquinone/menaquinone biosynthesis [Mycobacterium sp. JS623]